MVSAQVTEPRSQMFFIADNITALVKLVKIAQSVKKIMLAIQFPFVPCLRDEPGP